MSVPPARRPCRATSGRGRTTGGAVLVILLLTASLAGCATAKRASPPAPRPTPIARLNTASLHLPRLEFCPIVPPAAVSTALGGKPDAHATWGNGDRAQVTARTADLVHELGCEWTTTAGARARAWVFAQPVDDTLARSVVRAAGTQSGCRRVTGPDFGTPSATQVCREPGNVARVRHAGLFGQTWLSCEVTGAPGTPASEVRSRADAWCVDVAEALDSAS